MAKLINRLPLLIEQRSRELGRPLLQKEIAEGAGIDQGTLSRYINNQVNSFKLDIIEKLCVYFDVGIEELLYVDREQSRKV